MDQIIRKLYLAIFSISFFLSCIFSLTPALAQEASNIRVMVMVDDGDKLSIHHTNDIFLRVFRELQSQMTHHGYFLVDEAMLMANLGWDIPSERRSKANLAERMTIVNSSKDPMNHVRAMVVIKS